MSVFVLTTILIMCIYSIGEAPVGNLSNSNGKIRTISFGVFAIGLLILVYITGQRYYFGDTIAYMNRFDELNSDISAVISQFKLGEEWLFGFFMTFIKNIISVEPRVFIEIASAITVIPIIYFYYNYSGNIKMAIFFFVTTGCWTHCMNGLRQYLATGLFFLTIPLVHKKKWFLYIISIIIIAQIHSSALILLPLYFIANKEAFGATTKTIIASFVILAITSPITGGMLESLISSTEYGVKYSGNEWDYSINVFRLVVLFVPIALAYFNKDIIKNKYKYYDIVFNMTVYCFACSLLGIFSAVYARLNIYFECFGVLLLVWNLDILEKRRNYQWIKIVAIVMYILYFLYQMLNTYGMSWYERYLFFCNDWRDSSWI